MAGGELGDPKDDATEVVEGEVLPPETEERLVTLVAARLEHHQHHPIQIPDADALVDLKKKDPRAYKMWMRQVKQEMKHQRFMREAQFKMPLRVIWSGQVAALVALLAVLGLAF